MSNVDPVILERIRKLMRYANDGSASEGEMENALGHARRLMEKFNLEEKDVLDDSGNEQAGAYDSIKAHEAYQRAGGIDHFDRRLAWVPSYICDVRFYTTEKRGTNKRGKESRLTVLVFYGLPRDVSVAEAMYHELLATMRAMARFRLGEDWRAEFSSYCQGFTDRLIARARQLKQSAPAEAGTTAIVLVKDAMVKRWADANLSLSPGRASSGRVNSSGAYEKGSSDGSRVELGTTGLPKGRAAAPKRLN